MSEIDLEPYRHLIQRIANGEIWQTLGKAVYEHNLCQVYDQVLETIGLPAPDAELEIVESRTHRVRLSHLDLFRAFTGHIDHGTVTNGAERLNRELAFYAERTPDGMTRDEITLEWLIYQLLAEVDHRYQGRSDPTVTSVSYRLLP